MRISSKALTSACVLAASTLLAACGGGTTVGSPTLPISATAAPGQTSPAQTPTPSNTASHASPTPTPAALATPTASPSTAPASAPTTNATSKWVAAWGDAPTGPDDSVLVNQTVREIVKPTVGSRGTIRLHFSNYFGLAAITIGAVHVGTQTTKAAVTNDVPVTFGGEKSVTIPAGGFATSDTLPYAFNYGVILAVTEFIEGTQAALTFHEQGDGKVTSYESASNSGDTTSDTTGAAFTGTTMDTYLLDRVEVYGNYKETLVTFGSSTTDGYQSNGTGIDEHMSWPEQLADILHQNGRDDIAILNAGISGNIVAYPAGSETPVTVPNPVFGEPGFERFPRDVLGVPGVGAVIEYLGANDLREECDPMASEFIPYKQQFVSEAHAAGVRVLVGTTAPSDFCEVENPAGFGTRFPQGFGEEAERFALVAWEKATAPIVVDQTLEQPPGGDGVIDFDAAVRDPSNLSYMLPRYDSGDDVHPNDLGYSAMAHAIPLSLL